MSKRILHLLTVASALGLCQILTSANDIEPGKDSYNATRVTKPVTLDGNLADWAGVPVLSDPKFAIPKGSGASGKYVLFEEYSGGTWSGPDDQTSAVQVAWDADNVYLGFVVTDDYHENVSGNAWNGDSVQIMIANADRTARVALYNYALLGYENNQGAFVDQGGVLIHHQSGATDADPTPGTTDGVVARDGVKKKTIYEIRFPAASLGLTPPLTAGIKFGLGMAINDGDGALVDGVQYGQAGQQGQKGWGGLGAHSIVFGKTASETALVTLSTTTPTVDRLFFSAINPDIASFTFRATDKGSSIVDAASAKLTIDGKVVTLTSKKSGDATDFTYTAAAAYPPGSDHSYLIEVKDTLGNTVSDKGSFKTAAYLPASVAVQPDTSKPGFLVRTWLSAGEPNSIAWAEEQLAGLHGANDADTSAMTDKQFGNSYLDEVGTINYWDTGGEGNFPNDGTQNMPGVTTANNYALEIITYLELPAGATTMGVNSDDGFRVYGASSPTPIDAFAPILGQFDGGRGVADTTFTVLAEKAGVYPFRMIYEEGGGDSAVEWFTVKSDGTKVLINDTANGGIKAYRVKIGGVDPSIRSISPNPRPRQLAGVSASLSVVLSDGDTKKVDDKSIVLKVDGATITPTLARQGANVTLTYTPAGLLFPQDRHTANLTFKDTTGTLTRNESWTFYNLKNIVLPAPKILETFDTYPEDSQPTGWVATNFTSHNDDGRDITVQTSESYENWVLVKTEHINSIDGGRPFNIAPGLLYNGKEIKNGDPVGGTFPDWLMSGNVLYAESDSRSNTDALDRGYAGQTQFIVSKAFDCSQINDVVLSFSSIYEQNQDSLGAVEYSVDAGKTWLPVVYFLDGPDIKLNGDGTVDALRTFNDANTDTSNWKENDVVKGDKYGDGIGAAITADLGAYIVPRVNDDQVEGKRVEIFRLPAASKKADVRLRFAAMGTDSWYFAVDNIAFYDVPSTVTPPPASGTPAELGQTVNGFQDDFTGATRDPNWKAFGPGGDLYQQVDGVLYVNAVTGDPNHLLYMAPGYSNNVQEVLARIRVTAFGTGDYPRGGLGVGVATNTAELSRGINLHFRDSTQDNVPSRQFKLLDDARAWGPAGLRTNVPGQTILGWSNNTWYWLRLRQEPNAGGATDDVFGKVWVADGATPEPADWQLKWNYIPTRTARTGFAGITASSSDASNAGLSHLEVDYILIKAAGLPQTKVNFSPTGPAPTVPKFTGITKGTGTRIQVNWIGAGTLEQADTVNGPWTTVTGISAAGSINATAAAKFYRLKP